jgi:hypothetical protein
LAAEGLQAALAAEVVALAGEVHMQSLRTIDLHPAYWVGRAAAHRQGE